MAKKKLGSIIWPNLPNDTYILDAGKVEYSDSETYDAGTAGEAIQKKANADGYYENLTAGSANQLLSTVTIEDKVPYQFRTSGGSADIGDRETDMLVGGTVAWNQKVQNGDFATATTWQTSKVTYTVSDNIATVVPTENNANLQFYKYLPVSNGHKYFVSCDFKPSKAGKCDLRFGHYYDQVEYPANVWSTMAHVRQATSDGSFEFNIYANGNDFGTSDSYQVKNAICIDLTQLFGSTVADYIHSLETATAGAGVAWFKKLFPKPYYAYDAGTLKSVEGVSSHDMVGFNAWDEEWENCLWNEGANGVKQANANSFGCKNPIRIVGGATYYLHAGNGSFYVLWYDADMNLISYALKSHDLSVQAPSNAVFLTFYSYNSYGTTYQNDICINLSWDGERDGEYEPYVKQSYPLDDSLTLRGIPKLDSANSLYYDGDVYESDGTVTRRFGIVDMGTLTWVYQNSEFSTDPAPNNIKLNMGYAPVAICSKYKVVSWQAEGDKVLFFANNGRVYVHDTAYTDAPTFKTAMSGVYLVYELATPTTETADPYTNPQIVDDFGTEEYVTTSLVPVGHVTQYQPNLRAKLEMAPNSPDGDGDYIVRQTNGQNEYVPLVIEDALPATPSEDGTYNLKVTVADGVATLSWGN